MDGVVIMGKCKSGCGECCIYFPMPPKFVEKTRELAQSPIIKEVAFRESGLILPITRDGMCFLLNRETKRCSAYRDRPETCKLFGTMEPMHCPYFDFEGNKRPERHALLFQQYYYHTKEKRTLEFIIRGVIPDEVV
jgi:Fe-S-cluster containining protein